MKKLLGVLLLFTGVLVSAQEITVAAGADMNFALPALAAGYTKGKRSLIVNSVFGASGTLTSKILTGAKLNDTSFDILLSTDEQYPQQLIAEGLASKDTLYHYGVGRLVVWVPNDSPLDLSKSGIKALLDPSVKKIAIEDPAAGPWGRAAVAVLQHFGIYDKVVTELVTGQNVSHASHFVGPSNAQVGLIALSLALAPSMKSTGRYWIVPPDAYPALNQTAVLLSHSKRQDEARKFLDFLHSPEAVAVLDSYGFSPAAQKH
jgi:molybdate transport system substrate-binding protein